MRPNHLPENLERLEPVYEKKAMEPFPNGRYVLAADVAALLADPNALLSACKQWRQATEPMGLAAADRALCEAIDRVES